MKLLCLAQSAAAPQRVLKQAWKCLAATVLMGLLTSMTAFSQGTASVVSCESLATLVLPDTTITMAQPVAAGEFDMPERSSKGPGGRGFPSPFGSSDAPQPAFCRAAATLTPSSDSDINIEVWLPLSGWNGKFFGAGSFGWGGRIMYDGLLLGVQNNYTVASTDTGHDSAKDGQGGSFGIGHPEKMIDYGYRAMHEMTVKAKAITEAFYGTAPTESSHPGADFPRRASACQWVGNCNWACLQDKRPSRWPWICIDPLCTRIPIGTGGRWILTAPLTWRARKLIP